MTKETDWVKRWMQLSAETFEKQREYLIDLDRAIGDADHGENLHRGFSALDTDQQVLALEDPAEQLKGVAKVLLATVGGAAGPLYGVAMLRMARDFPAGELTPEQVAPLLGAAVGGLQSRGRAAAGEKTMVDAWLAAVSSADRAARGGADLVETWAAAARGAQSGAEATIPLQATKGRASYLGARSIGHKDPGAASSAYLLEMAAQAAAEIWGE